MKVSKHAHSCLLIEEKGVTMLIDPGNYTSEENALDVDALKSLDFILITHEHQDHMFLPLIKRIVKRFPDVRIISNNSVAAILGKEGIKAETRGNEIIRIAPAKHEMTLYGAPENVMFTVFGKLTHPGDSLSFGKTAGVLALPIQAPWGSMVAAVEKAAKMKPKFVIPIHDWHWNEKARKRMYEMAAEYLKKRGIVFKMMEKKKSVDIKP